LKWTTIMNNTYNVEVCSDLMSEDYAKWRNFKTNMMATGTNLTASGAVNPDPAIPQFYRIKSFNWVP
jgi:hypothetical protein